VLRKICEVQKEIASLQIEKMFSEDNLYKITQDLYVEEKLLF
jgi:hypothetical protein